MAQGPFAIRADRADQVHGPDALFQRRNGARIQFCLCPTAIAPFHVPTVPQG